jgi:hypothetical protein
MGFPERHQTPRFAERLHLARKTNPVDDPLVYMRMTIVFLDDPGG